MISLEDKMFGGRCSNGSTTHKINNTKTGWQIRDTYGRVQIIGNTEDAVKRKYFGFEPIKSDYTKP